MLCGITPRVRAKWPNCRWQLQERTTFPPLLRSFSHKPARGSLAEDLQRFGKAECDPPWSQCTCLLEREEWLFITQRYR